MTKGGLLKVAELQVTQRVCQADNQESLGTLCNLWKSGLWYLNINFTCSAGEALSMLGSMLFLWYTPFRLMIKFQYKAKLFFNHFFQVTIIQTYSKDSSVIITMFIIKKKLVYKKKHVKMLKLLNDYFLTTHVRRTLK